MKFRYKPEDGVNVYLKELDMNFLGIDVKEWRHKDLIKDRYEAHGKSSRYLLPVDLIQAWHGWVCNLLISSGRFTEEEKAELLYRLDVQMMPYRDAAKYYLDLDKGRDKPKEDLP